MDEHMRAWMWSRSSEDDYCNALSMDHSDSREPPYVDSLSQLNKIVERILPEKSPLSLASMRPKHDVPSSLRRSSCVDRGSVAREGCRKPSVATSGLGEFTHDCPTKRAALGAVPGVCLEESLRLKALRPSDSLNDSAYETFCGDGSSDAVDGEEKLAKTDEFSSGNDQADYCSSSSGRKSDDDGKEQDAELHGSGFTKKLIGEQMVGSNYCGQTGRRKSLDSAISCELSAAEVNGSFVVKHSTLSEPSLTGSNPEPSSSNANDQLFCGISGNRIDALGAGHSQCGEKSDTDETYGTISSTSVHLSPSLYADKHGPGLASSSCMPQRSSSVDSYQQDRKITRDHSSVASADEELKSFTCPHCAYSATKKGQVRKHLSVHGIFLCAHCEFACERADLLEEHRRLRHPGLCGRRLCKKCRVLFQSSELETHEKQCSGEKQRWACQTCGKEFKFLSVMKAHAHKWHPSAAADDDGDTVVRPPPTAAADPTSDTGSSKPCSVSSGTPTTATQPESIVGRESKHFQCPECGKMFKTKWTLANHSLLHAGADTPFCCDVDGCSGVTFRSDKELNCHRMAVHRLGPTKYECSHPGCTMQFAKYGHYKRHKLTHAASADSGGLKSPDVTGGRKFVCDWAQCGKAFSHPDNLRVHYRRHTDEKPYHCHHCEAAYRQKSGLKYHLEKVHGEKTVGRMGRKRKLGPETNGMLESAGDKQAQPGKAFLSSVPACTVGGLKSPVGQSDHQTGSAAGSSAGGNLTPAAVSKVAVNDSQTKQWSKSGNGGTAKCRRWSDSLSQACPEDLENIDINDEWLLNEDDGFIASCTTPSEVGLNRGTDDADRDPPGSTSDTEPLDEDLCEELRRLSDAINGEVLSPRDLDSMTSPFNSPVGPAFGTLKSDGIEGVLRYHDAGSQKNSALAYDQYAIASPRRDSELAPDFYSRHPEVTASTASIHGLNKSEDHSQVVNGYAVDGYGCADWRAAHFDGSNVAADSRHPAPDGLSCNPTPCEGSVHPWSAAGSYSRWSSQLDNAAFLPPHGSATVPTTTALADRHSSNLIQMWSSAETGAHWPSGQDNLISSLSRHHMAARAQPDLYAQHGGYAAADWRIGHHGPASAFSRGACDVRTGFDVAAQQTSPRRPSAYHADVSELPSATERFVDSYVGKRAVVYRSDSIGSSAGSWAEPYEQSPRMDGVGGYDYHLPGRTVHQSPLQPDRLYVNLGHSDVQSPNRYERADAETVYCVPNGPYPMLPGHTPSWPLSGFSGAGESLRRMPELPPTSVLYDVVPRYY